VHETPEFRGIYSTWRAFCGSGSTAWSVEGLLTGNSKRPTFSRDRGLICTGDSAEAGGVAFNDPAAGGLDAEDPDGSGAAPCEAAGCVSFPLPEILPRMSLQMSLFDDIRV